MIKKILVSLLASAGLLLVAAPAYASTPLIGWAWSSTIGWVSFNSTDPGAGGGPYSVQLSTSSPCSIAAACLTGYAWSPNIGWIQFGGLAGSTVNGTTTSDATVNMTTGAVTGWVRAIAGVGRTDGWDGWIELSGANHATGDTSGAGGITYVTSGANAGHFVGYSWGGPVVGWLTFNPAINPDNGTPVQIQNGTGGNTITGTCSVSPTNLVLPTGGGSVQSTATLISISDGTGPYSYAWSPGGVPAGGGSTNDYASEIYTYSTPSTPGVPYQPTVTVTDSTGATGTITCLPGVTVTGGAPGNPAGPALWITNTDNDQTITNIHIRSNTSESVSYSIPTGDSSCAGNTVSDPSFASWSGQAISGSGPMTFNGIPTGTYSLFFTCKSGTGGGSGSYTSVDSNTVTIIASPSNIHEQ